MKPVEAKGYAPEEIKMTLNLPFLYCGLKDSS